MGKRWLIGVAIAATLIFGSGGVAFAGGNERASCIGLDASTNAPVNEQIHAFQQIFVPFGSFVSTVAQLHEGSDEACVAAVLGPPG